MRNPTYTGKVCSKHPELKGERRSRNNYCTGCDRDCVNKSYNKKKDMVRKLKDVPCKDCGQRHSHWRMHFDHARGIKLFNASECKMSMPKLLEEIGKCDVVCVLCHADRTYFRSINNG